MSVILPGTGFQTDLRDDGELAAFHDVWTRNVYQLGRDQLEGTTVVDIGSNIGLFTAFALAHGAGQVIAVDPIVEHHERAQVMLGDPRSDVTWVLAAAGDGSRKEFGPGKGVDQTMRRFRLDRGFAETIDGTSLNDLIPHCRLPRIIVKVDCEGCEYELIRSASDSTLRRIERFVMEWHGMMGAVRESAAGRIGRMVERLLNTHSVTIFGDPNHGGMLYAYRY